MPGDGIPAILRLDRSVMHVEDPYATIWRWEQKDLVKNHHWFDKLPGDCVLLIDFSQEYWGEKGPWSVIERARSCLVDESFPYLILSHDPKDHDPDNLIYFFPGEYHRCRHRFVWPRPHDLLSARKYTLSSLNNAPRHHRVMLWYLYNQTDLGKNCLWSMRRWVDNDQVLYHAEPLPDTVQAWWNLAQHKLAPSQSSQRRSDYAKHFIWDLDHPAYTESYVNLVTEHVMTDHFYMSEKTWKPIAAGQLFLVAASRGHVDMLRSWGVDVFDDILDHSYDRAAAWQERCEQIIKETQRLVDLDWPKIWSSTAARRQRNIELFRSGCFDQGFSITIQSWLDSYK